RAGSLGPLSRGDPSIRSAHDGRRVGHEPAGLRRAARRGPQGRGDPRVKALVQLQREFVDGLYGEAVLEGRAAIYQRNLLSNLRAALGAAYPIVRRLVGDAFFNEAADRFARVHPSTSGDLHRYGESFPDFIAAYAPARSLEYLPDVARLEWAVAQAF